MTSFFCLSWFVLVFNCICMLLSLCFDHVNECSVVVCVGMCGCVCVAIYKFRLRVRMGVGLGLAQKCSLG